MPTGTSVPTQLQSLPAAIALKIAARFVEFHAVDLRCQPPPMTGLGCRSSLSGAATVHYHSPSLPLSKPSSPVASHRDDDPFVFADNQAWEAPEQFFAKEDLEGSCGDPNLEFQDYGEF
ncbi:hypothetical protein BS78_K118500 [Paspalum vaginatum]|uniref:Uncharacterized protein n=1 Tax=Paspalum vaginatum TaxID=158149 RepID=A0A9W7X8L2_9POAL|nr:hypothetical protein BS78_K118500 [Paspalum vaginatum]